MNWPNPSDFVTALMHPEFGFREERLRSCCVELGPNKLPRAWSGNFATVYSGVLENGTRRALRLFNVRRANNRDHYAALGKHLSKIDSKYLAKFKYHNGGIRAIDGHFYPLIEMEWVEGQTLFSWVESQCEIGATEALAAVADQWRMLIAQLGKTEIAHGDLQHGNVLVEEGGHLRLVDYDCMCVPSLVGTPCPELGMEPYQHPFRADENDMSLEKDRYSALLIYTALRALAANPQLWEEHVVRSNYDRLLFRARDFQGVNGSALREQLSESNDPVVRNCFEALMEAYQADISLVPLLEDVLEHTDTSVSYVPSDGSEVAGVDGDGESTVEHSTSDFHRDHSLRNECDSGSIHSTNATDSAITPAVPPASRGRDALHRLYTRTERICESFDRDLVSIWIEFSLAVTGAESDSYEEYCMAGERLNILDQLGHLLGNIGDGWTRDEEMEVIAASDRLPREYHHKFISRIRLARERIEAHNAITEALETELCPDRLLELRRQMAELGHCQEEILNGVFEIIEFCAPALLAFRDLDQLESDYEKDRLILEHWDTRLLSLPSANRFSQMYDEASDRETHLAQIAEAVDNHDDFAICNVIAEAGLGDYVFETGQRAVIRDALRRHEEAAAICRAIVENSTDDFVEKFDRRTFRSMAPMFEEHQSKIEEWTRQFIRSCSVNHLRLAFQPTLVFEGRDFARIRWAWPTNRHSNACLFMTTRSEPSQDDEPVDLDAEFRGRISREQWNEAAGLYRVNLSDVKGLYLSVWAEISIGFAVIFSEPLNLGFLEDGGIFRPANPR